MGYQGFESLRDYSSTQREKFKFEYIAVNFHSVASTLPRSAKSQNIKFRSRWSENIQFRSRQSGNTTFCWSRQSESIQFRSRQSRNTIFCWSRQSENIQFRSRQSRNTTFCWSRRSEISNFGRGSLETSNFGPGSQSIPKLGRDRLIIKPQPQPGYLKFWHDILLHHIRLISNLR